MSNVKALKSRRNTLKSALSRFEKFVNDIQGDEASKLTELKTRLEKIDVIWNEFDELQTKLEETATDDNFIKAQEAERDNFETKYFAIVGRAKQSIENTSVKSIHGEYLQGASHRESPPESVIRLPQVPLPEFSGEFCKWLQFRDAFVSLIHNNKNLTNVQRFYYLQGALKGDANSILASLDITDVNYEIAWDLLQKRFENKKAIITSHVQGILELQAVGKQGTTALRNLSDEFQKHYRSLQKLNQSVESWNAILIYILCSKLDFTSKREWEIFSKGNDEPSIADFICFISDRCKLLENISCTKQANSSISYKRHETKTFAVQSKSEKSCSMCNGPHPIFQCKQFVDLTVNDRFVEAKKLKLCTNCLRSDHTQSECMGGPCKRCGKRHNTLLHRNREFYKDRQETTQQGSDLQQNGVSSNTASIHNIDESQILLSTAVVNIMDANGHPVSCRALLDSGSQSNFMTEELFVKLSLNRTPVNLPVSGINMGKTEVNSKTVATIKSRFDSFSAKLAFLIVRSITDSLPHKSISAKDFSIPSNIFLADPSFNRSQKIDILIGAGVFYDLIRNGQIKLGHCQPILHKTKLGWIISGPTYGHCQWKQRCFFSLSDQIERFWELESYGSNKIYSREAVDCEKHFIDNFSRTDSGQFIVKLPLKEGINNLGESKQLAINRFYAIERKMLKNEELRVEYSKFMGEYEHLGHMSKVTSHCEPKLVYYLPHHAVFKHDSSTTKLRVVFDASAKTTTQVSLNDVLGIGPTIQDDLFSIILRFRKHTVAMTADITKMYRQIVMNEEHRDLQRIIWRETPGEDLRVYRLNTVTYGTASASFLATRCLQQLAKENASTYLNASAIIQSDFYMDDLITGANDIESAIILKNQIENILSSANFPLRKWNSNDRSIFQSNDNSITKDFHYIISDDQNPKILGISWNSQTDRFYYSTTKFICHSSKITKRIILSIISQLFDPLGLIGPVTIKAKIIMQRLWQQNISWDDGVPQDLLDIWSQYYSELKQIDNIQIPRQVILNNATEIEIHGFCDASESAYGACIYIRSYNNIKTETCLLCAKARVAPVKSISLPRLELCGAVLLTNLMSKVVDALKLKVDNIYYWCDSTIVLHWLAADPSSWKIFIAHRVSDIQQKTKFEQWHHIASQDNPADLISRGIGPGKLAQSYLWWEGPSWLKNRKDSWPITNLTNIPSVIPEARVKLRALLSTCNTDFLFNKFSTYKRLTRVTAYILRFINNCKRSNNKLNGELSILELEQSNTILLKFVQRAEFNHEIGLLEKLKPICGNSKLSCLNPFMDEMGILRVGGRLDKSDVPYNYQHPIVLPAKHKFTELLIKHEHRKNLHAGAQAILATIRQTYWPLNGRSTVRSVLRKCIVCFRAKPLNKYHIMGVLPKERITANRPFTNCGIDYGGPYALKDGKSRTRVLVKAYICIFVCFSTRAIHIELVGDLSCESFLNALKRFVSRRGLCQNIFCDNATNFVAANKNLHQICRIPLKSEILSFCTENKIHFHFIPPRSAHFGGLVEAAIKSTKYHLKRVMTNVNLTFEEFYTLLAQVEATLNSRPLLPLSSDPNDLEVITPGHFLIGCALNAVPQRNVTEVPCNRLNRYKHLQLMYQHFWTRWRMEYLHTLQQRSKWQTHGTNVKVGSLVILIDENAPPLSWSQGRIKEVHPGSDGVVRVVTVQTKKGLFKRATSRVCLLPIDD